MADEYEVYNELEAQRNMYRPEEEPRPEPFKMGAGSYVLILFSLFVDIIEMITTYTGVGAIISIPLGLIVDAAIFAGVGLSRDARKQWKRFAAGFLGENFPLIAQALEWLPIRTLALIWMYRGMSRAPQQEQSDENEENINEQ